MTPKLTLKERLDKLISEQINKRLECLKNYLIVFLLLAYIISGGISILFPCKQSIKDLHNDLENSIQLILKGK